MKSSAKIMRKLKNNNNNNNQIEEEKLPDVVRLGTEEKRKKTATTAFCSSWGFLFVLVMKGFVYRFDWVCDLKFHSKREIIKAWLSLPLFLSLPPGSFNGTTTHVFVTRQICSFFSSLFSPAIS
jgi:hypothetical protein